MNPTDRNRRTELLEIAQTCCGDCENCGAIGFELDRLAHAGGLEREDSRLGASTVWNWNEPMP